MKFLKYLLIIPIKIYQYTLSPMLGPNKCRYQPTCSHYAIEAIMEWGIFKGTYLAVKRILRCHPWSTHPMMDPVPKKEGKNVHQLVWMLLGASLLSGVLAGCNDYVSVPKPRAYPKVFYPEKVYVPFNEAYCDFTFEVPKYAQIEQDTVFFEEKAKNDCWYNIKLPDLNAEIFCSYYPIDSPNRYDELVADAFVMATKHNVKASYIEEIPIHRPADGVHGIIFNIEGPAASSYQFFLTDSTSHFLRGALYINTQSRPDSLAPVINFLKADVDHLAATLKWGK